MAEDITPNSFEIIASKNKIQNVLDSDNLAGTIGGMGTTPVKSVGKAVNDDGTVNAEQVVGNFPIVTVDIAARGWGQNCTFSLDGVAPSTTVNWTTGYFTSAGGTSYTIQAGSTGVMSAKTYIYFYPGTGSGQSDTRFQITTVFTEAVGAGKVWLAAAQNGTVESTFLVFQGGELNINGSNIVKNSITASEILANTITANEILANTITANELATSLLYAGAIVIDTAGLIRSGQTAYDTGIGWWIGNDGGTPKFSIGNPATYYMTWDGATLTVKSPSIESTIWIGSGAFQSDTAVYEYGNGILFCRFADGVTDDWATSFRVPASANGKAISSIKMYCDVDDDGSTKDITIFATTVHYAGTQGGAKTTDSTDTVRTYATDGSSANPRLGIITLNADVYNGLDSTMATDDVLGIKITRVAGDASDTYGIALDMIGITVTWA